MHKRVNERGKEVVPCKICGVDVVKQATQFDLCAEHRKITCVGCGREIRMRANGLRTRCSQCQAKRRSLSKTWGAA